MACRAAFPHPGRAAFFPSAISYYSQIELSHAIAGRQVTLRSLTAFPFIASRWENDGGFHPPTNCQNPLGGLEGRSPPSVIRIRRHVRRIRMPCCARLPHDVSRPGGPKAERETAQNTRKRTPKANSFDTLWGISSPKPLAWGPEPGAPSGRRSLAERRESQGAPLAGGPEPGAPSGRRSLAERRESQGATLGARRCEFPGSVQSPLLRFALIACFI